MRNVMLDLLKVYMKSWVQQDKQGFLSVLDDEVYIQECYGAAYDGINEAEKWFINWNNEGKVVSWNILNSYFDSGKKVLIATWDFHVTHPNEEEPNFLGVTILKTYNNKILELYEYSMSSKIFRPYK